MAEQYFRDLATCDLSEITELTSKNIVVSYPIYNQILHKPAIRGRQEVLDFYAGFCNRWKDPQITIEESIAEGNQVVLIWSYQARNVGSPIKGQTPSGKVEHWGGITMLRFNEAGKISLEIGEESAPGPFGRILETNADK